MLKIMVTAAILLGLAAPTASAATKHRRPAPVNAAVYNAAAGRPANGGVSLSTACSPTQSPCRTQPDTW